jgi:hypothetical protein
MVMSNRIIDFFFSFSKKKEKMGADLKSKTYVIKILKAKNIIALELKKFLVGKFGR